MNRMFLGLFLLVALYTHCYSFNNSTFNSDSIRPQVSYQPMQYKIGFGTGWETAYATGIELSFLFHELVDFNFGFGLGISGAKYGFGSRFYPIRNKKFSPMIGLFFYQSTGMKSLNVSVNEKQGKFKIYPDKCILVNTGYRFRFGKGHYVIGSIGYSTPFEGKRAQYLSGSTSSSVQSFANAVAPGGLSVQIGFLLKLSDGKFKN